MSRWGSFFRIVAAAFISYWTQNWAILAQQIARERQSHINARRNRRARDEYNAAQIDRLEMIERDARMPRTRCYGRVRHVEGVHRPWSSGTNDEKLTLPVSFAGHEIDGFEQWYLFDKPVTLTAAGWVQEAPYYREISDTLSVARVNDGDVTLVGPLDYVVTGSYVPGSAEATWVQGTGDITVQGSASVSVAGSTATVSGVPTGATVHVAYRWIAADSYVRIRPYLGTAAQNIGSDLAAEFPGKITSTDKAAGIAMAIVDCVFEPDVFPQGRPNVTAVFRAAKVYDPRKDSTVSGGSGAHRIDNAATWEWTRNPALIAYDWARYQFGMAVPADEINQADVMAAANACDVSTVFTLRKSPSVTETATLPRYQCDIVIPTSADPEDALDRIVATMGGRWAWAGGVLRMRAGTLNSTAAAVDEGWLMEGVDDNGQPDGEAIIQAAQGISRAERYNRVSGSCIDPDKRYQMLPYPAVEDAVLIAAKGEREAEIDFEAVSHIAHAQHLASMIIRQAQAGQKVEMRLGLKGLGLELLDVFSLTYNDRHGINAKTYEVVGWKFSPSEGVTVAGEEVSAALFTVDAELTGRDPAPDSDLREPWDVEQLAGLAVTSGAAAVLDTSILTRTQVSWTAAAGASIRQGGKVEIQYTPADSVPAVGVDWPVWPEEGLSTNAVIPGLLTGRFYLFRARFVQPLPLVRGAWSDSVRHQIAARRSTKIFRQTSAPTGDVIDGDEWFDTDDGNRYYVRVSGSWVETSDANKVTTFVQTSAPTAAAPGDLWMDSDDGNKLYRWNGSAWVALPIGTGGLEDSAATEIYFDEDAGPYSTFVPSGSCRVSFTTSSACTIIATGSAEIVAVNSSGSSKLLRGVVNLVASGVSPTAVDGRNFSQTLPDGSQAYNTLTSHYVWTGVAASTSVVIDITASDHTSDTASPSYQNLRLRVEVIKR